MGVCTRVGLAVVSLLVVVTPVTAQPTLSADVGLNSQFVWRGVTSTNRFVIQPEMMLDVPVRGSTLTLGAWGNIEPARYDGAGDLSSLGGLPGPFVTQSQGWVELHRTTRGVDVALGVQAYLYPHVGNLAQYTTAELYGSGSVDGFMNPTVTVSYDVARIRGAYIETGVSHAISGDEHGALTIGLVAGVSAGQGTDPRGRDLAYFDREGLTHIDASTSASFTLGHIAVAPEVHMIVARDALATVVAPDATRRTKVWLGTTVRWTNERTTR